MCLNLAMDEGGCLRAFDPTTTVICNRDSWVNIMVSGWSITFLLDTRSAYSILREFWRSTSPSFPFVGVGGQSYLPQQTPPLNCVFTGIYHSFLVMPTCLVPLMGRGYLLGINYYSNPKTYYPRQEKPYLLPKFFPSRWQ